MLIRRFYSQNKTLFIYNYYKVLAISIFVLFIHSYKNDLSRVFYFPRIIMYILNIANTIKKMTVKKFRDFVFENYHQRIEFAKENVLFFNATSEEKDIQLLPTKLTEKIPDLRDAKEHYQTFLRRKTQNRWNRHK